LQSRAMLRKAWQGRHPGRIALCCCADGRKAPPLALLRRRPLQGCASASGVQREAAKSLIVSDAAAFLLRRASTGRQPDRILCKTPETCSGLRGRYA
jgi:hypothetical protein